MALAGKGDCRQVDVFSNDLIQDANDTTEDMYTAMLNVENSFLVYAMGKGVNKSKGPEPYYEGLEKLEQYMIVVCGMAASTISISSIINSTCCLPYR